MLHAAAANNQPREHTLGEPAREELVRHLTNDEAAAYLRLSPRTLEKQRVIGEGPRFRKFGRRVLYAIDDLETWAEAGLRDDFRPKLRHALT